MKNLFFYLTFICLNHLLFSQNERINGKIIDQETNKTLQGVHITIKGTLLHTVSDNNGVFLLKNNLPLGEQILVVSHDDYLKKSLPIIIEQNQILNLGSIELSNNLKSSQEQFSTIDISENDSQENEDQYLLQANKDPYLKSVAYNWSSTFFKVRGLGSEYSKILINGIEMNKFYNHRPNWSNWSGLNDILKSQEISPYTQINTQNFGNLIGVTEFKTHSESFYKGLKISASSTNRSYQGRIMATYHSGKLSNNWSYSFSGSARNAQEGFTDGTTLNAQAFYGSLSYEPNNKHKLNLSFIYTPVKRGKTSPNTNEITTLKGIKYNAYWGFQNGEKRNSRIKKVQEPIITLSHFWKPTQKLSIQNNFLFQKGIIANSRLDHTGTTAVTVNNETFYEGVGNNTDPSYYQILPSYFLRNEGNEDYESAFLANRNFSNEGQINWAALYQSNSVTNQNATYILYNDVTQDNFTALNSIASYTISDKLILSGKLAFRNLISHNYAEISDLLGGNGYLDIDAFSIGNEAQNNLLNPNRIVFEGDDFRYNYHLFANHLSGFFQTEYVNKKWLFDFGFSAEANSYQRRGNYENGHYSGGLSLGRGQKIYNIGYGLKVNNTYQVNPKMAVSANLFIQEDIPSLQNIFINSRQSNLINPNIKNELNTSIDFNFNYQYNGIRTRLSAYCIDQKNRTRNSFFYTQDVAGLGRVENADFFQELITGMHTQNIGLEFGSEINLTNSITLQLSATYGTHSYKNNPTLQITSNSSADPVFIGETTLKNYHLANGPQQAYGLGFSYRDPSYWWFSSQLNFLNHSYINISPFVRTSNFSTDIDGLPFTDYDESRAKELLEQEKFPSYFIWNAIGGKSWRLKGSYLGFTLGIQNILNTIYRTGGFEQSRNSNYQSLNEDQSRAYPLFDPKYWYGTGTTFYLNTYIRF